MTNTMARRPMLGSTALPTGFKQTQVGVIPSDWQVKPLGSCASFKTGPFGSLLHRSDYITEGIPVINPMQIVDSKLVPTPSMTITETAARRLAAFRLSKGDVVIGRRGDMGRCARVLPENDGWLCGTGSMIVTCRSSLNSDFLQRVLSSPATIAAIENASVGTTMVNLNNSTLAKLLIQIPPTLAEQEAIASALSDADGLIESLEQLIAKKRQIKHGTMQELLTGKRRLPGFPHTEVGVIPVDWQVRAIRDCGKIITGPFGTLLKASEYSTTDGVPLISVGEVRTGFLKITDETPRVPEKVTKRLPQYVLNAGDIVFGRKGGVDRSARVREDQVGWFLGSDGISVRIDATYSCKYMAYQFQERKVQSWLIGHATGTTMPSLNQDILGRVQIPVPPTFAEQEAIATVLSDVDAEITALEAKVTKARQVKQGMMQELLTGRIRLV